MEILNRIHIALLCLAFSGCVHPAYHFWRTDKDLDEFRKLGGIEVSSPDGLYNGIMDPVPTNNWKKVVLQRMKISIEIPESLRISDGSNSTGIAMYKIHSHYPDARTAAQVDIHRKTKERYEEDLQGYKNAISEWRKEGRRDNRWIDLWEWRCVTFHATLEVDQHGTLYRRDIHCSNGDVLEIEGNFARLTATETQRSLYPEMDAVIRRIINSIQTLNVITNK